MTEQEKQEIIQALKEELSKELSTKNHRYVSLSKPYVELGNFTNDLLTKAGFDGKKAYDIRNSINTAIKIVFNIDRMCHLKYDDLPKAKTFATKIFNLIIENQSNTLEVINHG